MACFVQLNPARSFSVPPGSFLRKEPGRAPP